MTTPGPARDDRILAADGMRRLSHAMVGHHASSATLQTIAEFTNRISMEIEAGPPRNLAEEFFANTDIQEALAAGDISSILAGRQANDLFGNTMVSGLSNPMGVAAEYTYAGDEVSTRVVLGKAFEGAPGMAHGGIVAAIVDETMGAVLPSEGTLAFTAQLNLSYRAPTPIGVELDFTAKLDRREGRKLWISCICKTGDRVLVESEALFIAVDLPGSRAT